MNCKFISVLLIVLFIIGCAKKNDPFSISESHIGKLSKDAYISQLDSIFKDDSLVKIEENSKFTISGNSYFEIYEKGGKKLLSIMPSTIKDSLQNIQNVQVYDNRYTTDKGISLKSNFGEIKEKYQIKNTVTTLKNVIVNLKDSDLYFTIAREELPEDLRYGNQDIDQIQIPDEARIKYMMIDLSLRNP
ncbi:hypothetical protein ACJD0Z_14675 [Flavobacteriaceae bacterium M23B6Z8]